MPGKMKYMFKYAYFLFVTIAHIFLISLFILASAYFSDSPDFDTLGKNRNKIELRTMLANKITSQNGEQDEVC